MYYANLYLKPLEHPYDSYEECLRAGNKGKKRYEGISKEQWDQGKEDIDRYIPCIMQL